MRIDRRWIARIAAAIFAVVLLYPITAIFAHVGSWQWDEDVRGPLLSSVRVSLVLTAQAMLIIVAVGTPVAVYIARCKARE